ncbi:LamG-like jellyroll fold domain-containing protein [Aquimarina sp. BL5]|uniref:LamG-like jellyroll fold domain-containing protein n=2 Tax=Aquimarina sp. BL5 TaxID=1714860 RepID=UPI0013C2D47E|nr:LamG-like jellyroll fold domain-containing protein [Aquimarina sp. BL5]
MRTEAQVDLDNGLMAYFPFNGNASDESSNTNNGTVNGATLTNDRFGVSNSAYNFDGNDYISIIDDASIQPVNFTISIWCRFDSSGGLQLLLDKHLVSNDLDSYEVWFQNSQIWGTIGNQTGFGPFISSGFIPDTQNWDHVVYVFDDDNNTQKIFVNSVLEEESSVNISIGYDNEPLLIGASNDQQNPKFFFNGDLDDIRIYNRVLSENEITELFNESSTLGITDVVRLDTDFILFPSPAGDIINFESRGLVKSISFSSINGILLKELSINDNKGDLRISDLQTGTYIISIKYDNNEFQNKLFIKK